MGTGKGMDLIWTWTRPASSARLPCPAQHLLSPWILLKGLKIVAPFLKFIYFLQDRRSMFQCFWQLEWGSIATSKITVPAKAQPISELISFLCSVAHQRICCRVTFSARPSAVRSEREPSEAMEMIEWTDFSSSSVMLLIKEPARQSHSVMKNPQSKLPARFFFPLDCLLALM